MIRQAMRNTPFIASIGKERAVCIAIFSAAVCSGVPSGLTACPTG